MNGHYTSWTKINAEQWAERYPNFSPKEIACRGTGEIWVNVQALDALQALRNELSRPLIVTSAYRSEAHNARVGGSKSSKHLDGTAFDISIANHDPAVLEAAARRHGFKGIGRYPRKGFIHIDLGPARWWGAPEWPAASRKEFSEEPVSAAPAVKRAGSVATGAAGVAATVLGGIGLDDIASTVDVLQPALPLLDWFADNWWIGLGAGVLAVVALLVSRAAINRDDDEAAPGGVPYTKAVMED